MDQGPNLDKTKLGKDQKPEVRATAMESLEAGGGPVKGAPAALPAPNPPIAEVVDKIQEAIERFVAVPEKIHLDSMIAGWGIAHRTGHHRKLDDTSTLREVAEALGFDATLRAEDWASLQTLPERKAISLIGEMVDGFNERLPEGVEVLWDDDWSLGERAGLYLVGKDWESFPELEMGPGRMRVETTNLGALATDNDGGTCFFGEDDTANLRGSMHPDWAAAFSQGYAIVMDDPGYSFEGGGASGGPGGEDLDEVGTLDELGETEVDACCEPGFDPESDAAIGKDGKTIYLYGKPWLEVQDVDTLELEVIRRMEIEGHFPNLFNISDHGNEHLVNLNWSQAYRDPDSEKLVSLLVEMGISGFTTNNSAYPHRGNDWSLRWLRGQESISYRVDRGDGTKASGAARIEHPACAVAYREPEVAMALTVEKELVSLGLIRESGVGVVIPLEMGPFGKRESLHIRAVGESHYLAVFSDGLVWAGSIGNRGLLGRVGDDLLDNLGTLGGVASHRLMTDSVMAQNMLSESGNDFVRSCSATAVKMSSVGAILKALDGHYVGEIIRIPVPLSTLDPRLRERLMAALDERSDVLNGQGQSTGWVRDDRDGQAALISRETGLAVFFSFDPHNREDAMWAQRATREYATANPQVQGN